MPKRSEKFLEIVFTVGLLIPIWCGSRVATAAVGCSLSNPVRDLKYLFPQMTSYKEELWDFSQMTDGRALYRALNVRLGSDLDPLYEGYGTPYTIYTIVRGHEIIGYVHAVNVPGQGGLIQVVLSMAPDSGAIRSVSFQRLESLAAEALRKKEFLAQFKDLSLADFYRHDYYQITEPGSDKDRVTRVRNPVAGTRGESDYDATIRGVRKNLILLDFFVYHRRSESVYQQTRTILARRRK